jgi:cytochrome c6
MDKSNRKEPILMKLTTSVLLAIFIASSGAAFGADAAALWGQHCASCHGKDGSGNTAMGKKLDVKDYTKNQSFSDAEAANVIKNGKGKMKGYKDKLSDADVKALVAYVRSLKK